MPTHFSVSPIISAIDDAVNSTTSSSTHNKVYVLEKKISSLANKMYDSSSTGADPQEIWKGKNLFAHQIQEIRDEIRQIQTREVRQTGQTQQNNSITRIEHTDANTAGVNMNDMELTKDSQVDIYI